jgi:uncharacterized protein
MTCTTCGATLESTETICPVCATPVAASAPGSSDPTSESEASGASPSGAEASVTQPIREPSDPPHTSAGTTRDDATVGSGSSAYDGAATYGGQPAIGSGPAAPGGAAWQAQAPHPSGLSSEVRGWGIAAHLIGLGGALLTAVTLGFSGPLVVWLLKRDDHPFIDHHAKEALNFQLTTLVALVVGALAAIPIFLLGFLTLGVLWVVALIALLAATVVWFVFPIVGAVRAANGEGYRYPINIRFIR